MTLLSWRFLKLHSVFTAVTMPLEKHIAIPAMLVRQNLSLTADTLLRLEGMPDIAAMNQAAAYLTGMHDFASFCGNPKMNKSTVRTVDSIRIQQKGDYLTLSFHGDGFLQHMVRIMTGTLLEVGFHRMQPNDVITILQGKKRSLAGPTAPAQGLCLIEVDYN